MTDRPVLIGFEWSSPRFRAWAFGDDGDVLSDLDVREPAATGDADGAGRLRFHISEWLGAWPDVPVIGCGDVSGWLLTPGAPRLNIPLPLAAVASHVTAVSGVHIIPSLCQTSPPDLTCGAETVLLGLGEANGSVCIAGPHTRHCVVEHGRLLEFSTEITGELRDLLLAHGTLSQSQAGTQTFDMAVFKAWIERALDTGDTPPVFSVEAALRQGILSPVHKAAALAGLMIGADVAAHYDPGDEVLLVADGPLLEAYGFALDALGADVEETSALEALQEGLFEIADLAGLLGQD